MFAEGRRLVRDQRVRRHIEGEPAADIDAEAGLGVAAVMAHANLQ